MSAASCGFDGFGFRFPGLLGGQSQTPLAGREGLDRMESTMHQLMDSAGSISAKLGIIREKSEAINAVVTTGTDDIAGCGAEEQCHADAAFIADPPTGP